MDKEQALHSFFSSFGVPAYDVSTVPDDASLPRITYEVVTDSFDNRVPETFSIWDRSTSWKSVTDILHQIEQFIGIGGCTIKYDNGMIWINKATPFASRLIDEDDSIRRIVVNLELEFISEV